MTRYGKTNVWHDLEKTWPADSAVTCAVGSLSRKLLLDQHPLGKAAAIADPRKRSRRIFGRSATGDGDGSSTEPAVGGVQNSQPSEQLLSIIRQLPGTLLLVDENDRLHYASEEAAESRLVRRKRVAYRPISDCAALVRATGKLAVREVSIPRPPMNVGIWQLSVRAVPLGGDWVLLVIDDLTEENRVLAVRRDFIANISHELKTPVGAVTLLAEALVAARDDPEAVSHFAEKMQIEATRLSNLINDVIHLSRLQGEDPLLEAQVVSATSIIEDALDFVRETAKANSIELTLTTEPELWIYGDLGQLVAAVGNVLSNAIAYSPPHTQVVVASRKRGAMIEISVTDQGIGIPEAEQDRIFERFYRVDAARSRVTGGTGLGLSIVRNVCSNHGGDVQVWSATGEGATFTLRLPEYQKESEPA
ncbi:MAG: two-component sensor histidine kinase [Actinomycetia bacterium]|nr:two-component sensor histidine kinase [Actinomycetes bacterium]